MKRLLPILLFLFVVKYAYPQVAPSWYITFDNASPLTPTIGSGNLSVGASAYSIGNTSGIVGQYITRPYGSGQITNTLAVPTSSFTWMGWIRPGYEFNLARNSNLFNFGYLSASLQYPEINFHTSTGVADDFYISFNGINKASWYNLFNGQWHHLTFVYNATTGTKQVWIDGQLPAGWTKSVAPGSIPADNGTINYWNDGNCPLTCYPGDMDEVAVWINSAVSANQIYNNYLVSLAGGHYTTALYSGSVPAAQATTGPYDPYDFAIGTTLPTTPSTQTTGATQSAITQLRDYPLPRYKPIETGSDSLLRIFSSSDPIYLGGLLQSGVSNPALDGANISDELAYNYNWIYCMWQIGQGLYASDTSTIQGKIIKRFKANYRAKLQGWTFRPQTSPYDKLPCDVSQPPGYPNYYFLQNSSGQPIDIYGNVTSNKNGRPSYTLGQSYSNFPDTAMKQNSDTNKAAYGRISTALGAGYNVFLSTENGEDFKRYLDPAMNADPLVTANRIAAGVNNITFQSEWRKRNTNYYSSNFLGSGTTTATDSTYYSEYQVQGNPNYFHQWAQMRLTQFQYRGGRMPTTDLYVRTPNQWLYANGANHGMRWAMDCQPDEFASGDILTSPFVSAGWDENECNNVRPAQWLGFNKCLGAMGAETYYPAMFSLYSIMDKNPHPKNYIWAMIAPSYAQAISSRFERILHAGYLLQGDMAQNPNDVSSTRAYWFNSGNMSTYAVVRKDSSALKYVIAASLNPMCNYLGGAPSEDSAHIVLASQDVKFMVRRQGSVYYYDNSVSPAVFYQLDKWHEASHPSWWTKDFNFEAEVNDNYTATEPPLKTYQSAGAAAGDYRDYRTVISYPDVGATFDTAKYYFQPRTATTYYLWVSMRSRTGNTTGININIDGASSQSITGVTDTQWFWYRRNGQNIISFTSVSAALHCFSILAQNKYVEVDAILLTTDPNLIMPNNEGICGTVIATITPSSASVCTGSSATFTANANTSYVWSTGATTQSISPTSAGSYTVTVYDSFGCSGTSSPATLTVNSVPAAPTVTPGGPISFCSGSSVTLSSSAGTTYQWSSGATTSSIVVSSAGTYRVTITNAAGCTASSSTVTINVNAKPVLASISPVANTCPATDFNLSTISLVNTGAAGTSSYYSSQSDAIAATNPISSTVTVTGTYWIRVTTDSSCYDYKSVGVVISNCSCVNPPTADAGVDQSICSGSTATMAGSLGGSASVGTWSTSGTGTFSSTTNLNAVYTPSVADRSNGSVTITLTTDNPLGAPCAVATNIMILTINAVPSAVISASGSTTFCSGGSVNIVSTASATYLWSSGATTQAITVSSSGTYTCTVTSSAGCSNTSNAITVTSNAPPSTPTITAGGSTTFCEGDSVQLTSSSASGNTWSTADVSQSIYAKDAGSYIVTVTNVSGCTASSTATLVTVLQVPNTPTITTSQSPILCQGDSVTLTSSRTSGNVWSPGSETTRSITVTDSGDYYVTVTNVVGCTAVSATTEVSIINCNSTCTTPTLLTVGQIGKKSANLGWNPANVATDYIIFLKNTRNNVLTKISVQGNYHKWQVKNLESGTAYQWYVQAVCGCCVFTDYSVKKTFRTK